MTRAKFGPIDQIGYLVQDLDASVRLWIERLGVGPWTVFRNVKLEGDYRGQPTVVTMDVALSYQGFTQMELIKVTNTEPSPYRQASGEPILGIHHIAWIIDDLDTALATATQGGLRVAFRAGNASTQVAYLESPEEPGLLFELIQGEGMRAMVDAGIAAARGWDRTEPVHEIDLGAVGQSESATP